MLPPTDENKKEQIDLVLTMAPPERRIGYSEDHLPLLQKAEAQAGEMGDTSKRLTIRSNLGIYYILKDGNSRLGWEYLESCSEQPELIQDIELMVPNGYDLCVLYIIPGDYQGVTRVAPTIIGLIENSRTQAEFYSRAFNPYSFILGLWGFATGQLGHFDSGDKLLERALSFAQEINHRATLGAGQFAYGCLLAIKGDGGKAIRILKQAIKDLEESQTMLFVGLAWTWLGYAYWLTGDYRTALEFTQKGLKIQADLGLFFQSNCHWCCSLAHFGLGNLEEAGLQAEQALKCSLANNEKQFQGMSRNLLGRVLTKVNPGQIEAAEEHIRQGISLLEELGALPFSGVGYLWLGEIYAESGRKEAAMVNLKKAETLFREMGMDYWLDKAQEALAKL
jgi:tetratricopeptide (TPR) repeat protein